MKTLIIAFIVFGPFYFYSQSSDYNVKSYLDEGTKAPNTHYIGEAWLNALLQSDNELITTLQRQPLGLIQL